MRLDLLSPGFEAHLSDPWAPHPIANRHILDGGGGKGKGGGIGGILGDIAGVLLAPETGGLSIAVPALAGAAGNLIGDAVTGEPVSPLGVVTSAAGGALGGAGFGGQDVLGFGGEAAGAGAGAGAGALGTAADAASAVGGLPGISATAADAGASAGGAFGSAAGGAAGGAGAAAGTGAATEAAAPTLATSATTGGVTPAALENPFGTSTVASGAPGVGGSSVFPEATGESGSFALSSGGTTLPGVPSSTAGELAANSPGADFAFSNAPLGSPGAAGGGALGGSPGIAADPSVSGNAIPASSFSSGIDPSTVTAAPASSLTPGGVFTPSSLAQAESVLPGGYLPGAGGASSGLGGITDFIKNNKELLGVSLAGAGIGKQLLGGGATGLDAQRQQMLQQIQQLMSQVTNAQQLAQLQATQQQLMSGQLTPEQQQTIQNQLDATNSAIKGRYAQLGMSGSTSEMEDLAAATAAAAGTKGQLQQGAINSGLQSTSTSVGQGLASAGMSANIASQLASEQLAQDAALSEAISRLAAAALA